MISARASVGLFAALVVASGCAGPRPSSIKPEQGAAPPDSPQVGVVSNQLRLPVFFAENLGQMDPYVAYYARMSGANVYFTPDGLTYDFMVAPSRPRHGDWLAADAPFPNPQPAAQRFAIKLDLVDANPAVAITGAELTPAVVSYFKGGPEQWKTGVPTYGGIEYTSVWPGIDMVYSADGRRLKQTFVVQPGADPSRIELAYRGASAVSVQEDGRLEVVTPLGALFDEPPYAYQDLNEARVEVAARYAIRSGDDNTWGYGFEIGPYDPMAPLILDPVVLLYAGYIGGTGGDVAEGVAVDTLGNAYVVGSTFSPGATFPIAPGFDQTYNGGAVDVFVVKVNPAGTGLVYATYLGGSSAELAHAVAVDLAGNAYVTGGTASSDFPVVVGPDLVLNGDSDAFVTKISPTGTALIYSGFIGGGGGEDGRGIAVDVAGNAYVAGGTNSDQMSFPVNVGPDLTFNGGSADGWVAKINPAGTTLVYAGYVGGSGRDLVEAIAIDAAGNAFVTGTTDSNEASFPVAVGPDLTFSGAPFIFDAFVAKVNVAGTGLVYAGYIGGTASDFGKGIAVDSSGSAYVAGTTASDQTTFPVTVGPDLTQNGDFDAFIAKLTPSGSGFIYLGYIGGSGGDAATAVAVDSAGNAYVAGEAGSTEATFPVSLGPDLTFNGPPDDGDAFVAKVRADGTGLIYSGYIGGSAPDEAFALAIDPAGNAYVVGSTQSDALTFPTVVGPDVTFNGDGDAFVAKVSGELTPPSIPGLLSTVQNLPGLNQGERNSLIAKLNAASDAVNRGNVTAACNQLDAFINDVLAFRNSGRIAAATANGLISDAQAVKNSLGCP